MTRAEAERRAARLFGRNAMIRAGEHASSPERRAEALECIRSNRARRDAIDSEIARRLAELDWYQTLKAERARCVQAITQSQGWGAYYKFAVGTLDVGFHVEGQGDTWEEAFDRARPPAVTTGESAGPANRRARNGQ